MFLFKAAVLQIQFLNLVTLLVNDFEYSNK